MVEVRQVLVVQAVNLAEEQEARMLQQMRAVVVPQRLVAMGEHPAVIQ